MQQITADPFLLEVARTLDENNIRRRLELINFPKKQRLITAFRALKQAGFAQALPYGDGTRWYPTVKAVRAMELEDFKLSDESFEGALTAPFYFLIEATATESMPDKQLVQEYRNTMNKQQLKKWWRLVGTIVGRMAEGHLRMIGPEIDGGFMVESLEGDPGMTGIFLFSLGSTSTNPVVTKIQIPVELKERKSMFECLIKWARTTLPRSHIQSLAN